LFEENRRLREVIKVINNYSGDRDYVISDENDSELSRASSTDCQINNVDKRKLIVNTTEQTGKYERAVKSDAHEAETAGASDEMPQCSAVNLSGSESTYFSRVVVSEAQ
jgi:hypothetical protein